MPSGADFQPLSGRRIIDVTQVLAGPYCTYQLALLGAEVIKIEMPGAGDWSRSNGPESSAGLSGFTLPFITQNSAKKSVTLDLKKPAGRDALKALIASADAMVENFKPGTAAKLGISYQDVQGLNPKLVYASLSAFGHDGPLSQRPAYDHIIQGMSGIMHTTGTPDSVPNKVGSPYIDYATGLMGAFAVVSALMEQTRSGVGQYVDVAMLDTAMLLMASLTVATAATGLAPPPTGNEAFSGSPASGTYATKDGMVMLAANTDPQFHRLCQAIGRADLSEDERFAAPAARRQNTATLKAAFAHVFATETAAHWETLLSEAMVPSVRIRRMDEVVAEPQLAARGLLHPITLPDGQEIAVPSLGFKANGAVIAPDAPPPRLGADTDAVLGALGLDLDALRQAGAI
jgi:crotonobetainyl-CoA:carnitine CoA-transferase CaiB-like acyl-CoA transferase